MEIKKKHLTKYLHDLAIEQIAEDYRSLGYTVRQEEKLGKFQADLVVSKGNENIVIEVKAGKLDSGRKEQLARLADYVKSLGNYKFQVVVATPPKDKIIEVESIEPLLNDYVLNNFPDELDELSTHTTPDEITDVDVDEIKIAKNSIEIKGTGVISVEIQFGSDGDFNRGDGWKGSDNFPFEFDLELNYNEKSELQISEVFYFKVDTSSYYE